MALSVDVNLPRQHNARYPQRCVRCGQENHGNTIRLWTHTIGWWTLVFWTMGWGFSTRAPACQACAWRIRAQRIGGLLVTIAIATLFMFFVWPHLDELIPKLMRRWVALVLILVCISPYWLWEVFWPPAIDITAFKDSVDYEFKSLKYAMDFAELNQDAQWVRINNHLMQ